MKEEYFSPEVLIKIGSYELSKWITLDIKKDIEKNFDFAIIKFTDKILEKIKINIDDDVQIFLGYNGKFTKVFIGKITSKKENEVIVKNDFLKLSKLYLTETFTRCNFDEVLKFILSSAGIEKYKFKNSYTNIKNLISIKNKNGLDAIKYIEQKYNIKNSIYYFDNDNFYYNERKKQNKLYTLKYGENILNLQNTCPKTWEVETISMPELKVLDEIKIEHYKLKGIFEVQKINFIVNEYGFIRTKITMR